MNRPYIFCHMMTALDGKIMGSYMETPQGNAAGDVFYNIAFGENPFYHHQGWLSGRVTTDDNFTFYKKPDLDENAQPVPEGDFLAQPNFGMFYVSVDPHGKLGWESSTLHYVDTSAHVIEILTEQVSNAYKAFLRKLGISYLIAGRTELDYGLALSKLKEKFHIETLMLGGGGVLNWSFLQAGMCDEISIVLAAAADGSPDTPPVFRAKEGLSQNRALGFGLKEAKAMDGGSVWLRYTVNNQSFGGIFMKYENRDAFEAVNMFGTGVENTAFARYFIGDSFLNPLTNPKDGLFAANVTFEPGCRNNWHIHHAAKGGGQLLLCTAGEGWYQEEGKAAVSLHEGSVVMIPANVKHWHGAKKDSWFSHIAVEVPGENCENEWCEPVSDEDYAKL